MYDKENDTISSDYEWANPRFTKGRREKIVINIATEAAGFRQVMSREKPYIIRDREKSLPHLMVDARLRSVLFVPIYVDGEFKAVIEIMKSYNNDDWTESEIQLVIMASSTYSMFFSRQQVAENLVQALISAENANSAKSVFLSNVSHEIRTPLNAIIGMTNMALRDELSGTTREYINKIKNASDVLLNVINNVLDMSKIEAAKLEIINDYFELKDTLSSIKNVVSIRADEKGQTLDFEVEENAPEAYYGDSFRLMQIIMNILYNAIKFSGDNSRIVLRVSKMSSESQIAHLKFEIVDQGVGMTPEQMERLFVPFEQGDKRTVRKYGGTGLGLAISKQIAELMGGTITARSEAGKGSIFTIVVAMEIAEVRQSADMEACNYAMGTVDFSGKNILIVEDVEINREIVRFILESTHAQIDEAENGRVAVERFIENPQKYDLILMDIQMPELDGYTATRMIREMDSEIPIVAMTAHAFKEDKEKSLEIGMNDHMSKPIDENTLLSTVAKYIL